MSRACMLSQSASRLPSVVLRPPRLLAPQCPTARSLSLSAYADSTARPTSRRPLLPASTTSPPPRPFATKVIARPDVRAENSPINPSGAGAGAGAQKAEMTERVNKLTSFDVLGDTLAPSALRIRSAGTFGFTVGDLSYKGPVMVVNNAVMMWDCLQFGVGSDVLVKELEGELGGRQRFDDPSSVFHDWTTENFEVFTLVDLMPEILVLGTGANMFLLPPFLREYLNSLGMQVEVMPSRSAASTYNLLMQEGRNVAAALLPLVPTSARTGLPLVDLEIPTKEIEEP